MRPSSIPPVLYVATDALADRPPQCERNAPVEPSLAQLGAVDAGGHFTSEFDAVPFSRPLARLVAAALHTCSDFTRTDSGGVDSGITHVNQADNADSRCPLNARQANADVSQGKQESDR